ncbi:MAG TPA: hypothetical protein VFE33_08205 [Thermoanaerobaculia bacterium]|nr:hypothetical protein [Thermoanaerobaculia bacterium]
MTSLPADFRCNGIDAATGEPYYPPLPRAAVSRLARGLPGGDPARAAARRERRTARPRLGLREGLDPKDLAAAGWGIVFPKDSDPAVREALAPLVEHRRAQAAARDERFFRLLAGEDGVQPSESWRDFRNRHGGGPDEADPAKLPFYLLLVGDPEALPFELQGGLDLQYAVGRLAFDTAEEYAHYAQSVVAAETIGAAGAGAPRCAACFGVQNPGDPVMELTALHLVPAVASFLARERPDWTVATHLGETATKAHLARLLGGEETPALLFTATHGVCFHDDVERQRREQGSLLCQDWPGSGAVTRAHYFCAEDVVVEGGHGLAGLIAFHFACHGAGTPRLESYPREDGGAPRPLAPAAFVSRLPQRLLAHPQGGALAVVGHVERAWCHSFVWNGEEEAQMFQSTFLRLLDGYPVGAALEPFGQRYAHLAVELEEERQSVGFGKLDDSRLLELWTAANDARNYALLGDPAVRLPG